MFNIILLSGIINNVVATEKILTGSGTRWIRCYRASCASGERTPQPSSSSRFTGEASIRWSLCPVSVTKEKDGLQVETIPVDIRRCVPYINMQKPH